MRIFEGARDQLKGEDSWDLHGRHFEAILLPAEAGMIEQAESVEAVLKEAGVDPEEAERYALDADLRTKYNEPNQRQILFLIRERSTARDDVLNWDGGALLVENMDTEEPDQLMPPSAGEGDDERSEQDVKNAQEGSAPATEAQRDEARKAAKEQEEVAKKGRRSTTKKRGKGGLQALAYLSKADLTVMISGEGLILTFEA